MRVAALESPLLAADTRVGASGTQLGFDGPDVNAGAVRGSTVSSPGALLSSGDEDENEDLDVVHVNSRADVTLEDELLGSRGSKKGGFREAAVLFAMTINYIFGAGVLSLPHQVAHGGILASSILLVFSSGLCLLTMVWILESQDRAKVILGLDLRSTSATVEFREIVRMFVGTGAARGYDFALTLFVVSSSWMYASIFAVSVSKTLPLMSNASSCDLSSHQGFLWTGDLKCWGDYLIYLGIFAVAMSFLVRTNIANMGGLQMILTAVGLTAIVTMVITVTVAIPHDGIAPLDNETKYFNAGAFGSVFGTFVFAQLSHHGVPLLSSITKRKELVRPVFISVICTTTVLYLCLGIMCAIFFGVKDLPDRHQVNSLISLDWADYTAGKMQAGPFADFISYFIRLYPAVTVSAAFPLYVITLGNSWHSAYYGSETVASGSPDIMATKTWFYVLALALSIGFAAIMANISFMLFFVGMSAFVIAFFLPPLMQLNSLKMVQGCERTFFSSRFSKPFYCYICLTFATFALLYTLYSQFF